MSTTTAAIFRFGSFTLHCARGQLVGADGPVDLRPKSFALLCHFVEHAGRLLSKDELGRAAWHDAAVTDELIARCVSDVRRALDDRRRQLIKTLPGRGYLFQATVEKVVADLPAQSIPAGPGCRASLAVLPFIKLDDEGGRFGRGIAEDMIVRLSKFPGLRVMACARVGAHHGPIDELQAGRESGARYLMAGSIRRAGDRTRLTVRLVDVATGVQIWAERYDVPRNATFDVQDDLAQRIVAMLVNHLRRAEIEAALHKPVERLDAYDIYLRGVAALRASEVSGATSGARIAEARALLQQSLASEPHHAAALISLSVTFMASWGTRRQDPLVAGEYRQDSVMEQALQCARQAVNVEPFLAEGHAQLGWCLHNTHRRHEAMEAYRRAFELNGGLTDRRYGLMLAHGGRHDEAIAFMQRAARCDPLKSPFQSSFGADPHYLIGDYRTALALSRAAAESAPAFTRIRIWQAAAAARLGFDDEARGAARAALSLDPDLTVSRYLDQVRFARADDGWHLAAGLDAAGIPA